MTNQAPEHERFARARRGWKVVKMFEEVASPITLIVLVAGLLLALVGLLGGWQRVRAAETTVATATAGEAIMAGPFTITIADAWFADPTPDFMAADTRAVLVRGTVTNTSDAPVAPLTLSDLVRIELPGCVRNGADADPASCPYMGIERTWDLKTMPGLGTVGMLQPDVPTAFVMTFTQKPTAAKPTELRMSVRTATWRASSLDGQMMWLDPEPVKELTLPLQKWTSGMWGKK